MTDDVLQEAKEAFRLAEEREADNRREALEDLTFARLGEQWPAEIRRKRQDEGRPCLTVNRLPAFARWLAIQLWNGSQAQIRALEQVRGQSQERAAASEVRGSNP